MLCPISRESNNMLMEKYSTQLDSLRQQVKTLPELYEAFHFEDEVFGSSDDDSDEEFVDGQPSSAQVVRLFPI